MTDESRGRCLWEVRAGLIPRVPDPQWTRYWYLSEKEWDGGSARGQELFMSRSREAADYAASLVNPTQTNWVDCHWIWF